MQHASGSAARAYRFGAFRLDPAARELRHDGRLLALPRRVFDGLAYLVEHRERAVGHDELIAALWGRVDVANAQLSQLIMQVRRAVGDDSQAQHSVRTIAGFGYRWVVPTETLEASDAPAPTDGADDHAQETAASATRRSGPAPRLRRPRRTGIALLGLLLFAALLALGWRAFAPRPLANASGDAVVVLPFDVDAPEDIDAGWARLGVMDLVAGRLRRAGLPVPPSDSVVAAVHTSAGLPDAERIAALRRTLGAGMLVKGLVTHGKDGWTIELNAEAADDARRRVETGQREIVAAASRASDLLLAALGRSASADADPDAPLEERLQRVRAALLSNQLDTARTIVEDAPESMRRSPELRSELARIEFHAGRLDRAEAIVDGMLADPAVAAAPRLRAKALRTQAWVAVGKDRGWATAERSLDAAVQALAGQHVPGELGKALAERGVARAFVRRLDEAALDLGEARAQLEIAGDRQGLGEMNNYLGQLELLRLRVDQALGYFRAAAGIAESFGSIDTLRYNLTALLQTQMRLLRWPDALASGERLWALRERIENAGLRAATEGYYALALLANGHSSDAERVLAPYATDVQPAFAPEYLRFVLLARAELATQRGQPDAAFAAATRALDVWPPQADTDAEERARAALLRQRASIALGRPVEARIATLNPKDAPEAAVPDRIARAEWAAAGDREADAERLFRDAAATAEAQGVPDMIVLASDAYARWLLARGRSADAIARSGRIGVWAGQDFDSALLQAAVFHAGGESEAWTRALRQVQPLAGERVIPAALLKPPAVVASR